MNGAGARRIVTGILRDPAALAATVWLVLLVAVSALAPVLAPYNPLQQDLTARLTMPSWQHLLGTDSLGRDLLSRVMFGGGTMLWGAAEAAAIALFIGMPLGLVAGYLGGLADTVILWTADLLFAVPALVVIIAVAVIYPSNTAALMAVLGVLLSALVARLVRTTTRQLRNELFVDAARVAGLSRRSIIFRHILPMTVPAALMQTATNMAVGLLTLASLSFLGLGTSPAQPSWGELINDASQQIAVDAWLLVPPGVVLTACIIAFNVIASTLRDLVPGSLTGGDGVPRHREPRGRRRLPGSTERSAGADNHVVEDGGLSDLPDPDAVLSARDLRVSFTVDRSVQIVVDRLRLDIRRGQVTGLVGESGSGKSVTAQALLGLTGSAGGSAAGSVRIGGQEIAGLTERQLRALRRGRVGYISQEPMVALDPSFTVGSQLREALRNVGTSRRDAAAASLDLLRRAGIGQPERVSRLLPQQISGGMAQRVCIALALAGSPEVIVADEPTTALDVTVQAGILDLLRTVVQQGTGILLVTHDFGVVADVCDEVAVMYAGQIVEHGPAKTVLANPRHPYTIGLLQAVPSIDRADVRPAMPGTVPSPGEWPSGCRFAPRCRLATQACSAGPIALVPAAGPDHPGSDHRTRCISSALVGELAG